MNRALDPVHEVGVSKVDVAIVCCPEHHNES